MKAQSSIITNWDREADVVVVGYGAAGAAAAITAHDAGAKVIVLEKAPEAEAGGNSRVSGQGWLNLEPFESTVTYYKAMCGFYTVEDEMIRALAIEMGQNTAWVRNLGAIAMEVLIPGSDVCEFPELPGSDCVHMYSVGGKVGYQALWKLLKSEIDKRQIEVLYAAPGKELFYDQSIHQVLGIQAEHNGEKLNIKAKKAVILTCGGFENNQEMIRNYLFDLPYCYPVGTPHNTGDGIKMAMEVGADLWHMNNIAGPWFCFKAPGIPSAFEIAPLHFARDVAGGAILVGPNGKRFIDEKHKDKHGKIKVLGRWMQSIAPCPMYLIFDQTLCSAGPVYNKGWFASWNSILNVYDWSNDNRVELAKGWIKKADTIGELAAQIKLDPSALEGSIQKWNQDCAAGKDSEFGRERMLVPIKGGPYYGMEISPAFINSQGGPKRNSHGQIVDTKGEPIGRLYSAGELGSIHSFLYQGGGNIGECLAFGRISGLNAAAEKPWD
jgi:succinate dehydrogenase/fumarate reductase flavoprotein subunit